MSQVSDYTTLDPWGYWPASEDRTAVDMARVIAQDPVQAIPLVVQNNPGAVVANWSTATGAGFGMATTPEHIIADLTRRWEEGDRKGVQDILAVQWIPGADAEQDKAVQQLRDQYNMPEAGLGQLWNKLLAIGADDAATITTTGSDTPKTPSKRKKYVRYALIGLAALALVAIAVYLCKQHRR